MEYGKRLCEPLRAVLLPPVITDGVLPPDGFDRTRANRPTARLAPRNIQRPGCRRQSPCRVHPSRAFSIPPGRRRCATTRRRRTGCTATTRDRLREAWEEALGISPFSSI